MFVIKSYIILSILMQWFNPLLRSSEHEKLWHYSNYKSPIFLNCSKVSSADPPISFYYQILRLGGIGCTQSIDFEQRTHFTSYHIITRTKVFHKNVSQGYDEANLNIIKIMRLYYFNIQTKFWEDQLLNKKIYRVVQKKFKMWSRGKVFEKFLNIFWWTLSLFIFTSSQEVRAF